MGPDGYTCKAGGKSGKIEFAHPTPVHTIKLVNAGKDLVTIHTDTGKLEYGEGYEPDQAAETFWRALAHYPLKVRQLIAALEELSTFEDEHVRTIAQRGLAP